jgi:DNA-directed RNA polymerase subunit alpha
MARIPFQKPKHIDWEILSDRYGRLVAEPFEKGYALTVGHSLRRALLAIIPGAAVTWARVAGVATAEAPIPGLQESTDEFLLNLRKLAVNVPSGEPTTTRIDVSGPREVTGADVSEATGIEVLNPELLLGHLGEGGRLSVELGVDIGRGYVTADELPAGTVPAGAIPLNAAFSPITRVSYAVENARLGAAAYMRDHFALLAPARGPEDEEEVEAAGEAFLQESLGKPLEELALPARAINALRNSEMQVVADLVQKTEQDLETVKNLGEKSIDEIKTALGALGLSLGMRIDPTLLGALGRGGAK